MQEQGPIKKERLLAQGRHSSRRISVKSGSFIYTGHRLYLGRRLCHTPREMKYILAGEEMGGKFGHAVPVTPYIGMVLAPEGLQWLINVGLRYF